MALPKANRLRERKEFTRVYRRGQRWGGKYLLLRIAPQQRSITPVVMSKPGKVGKPLIQAAKPTKSSLDQRPNPSSADTSRIAVVVSLKVSKRAVVRNRLRRQIQAAIQQFLPQLILQKLIIITVKPEAVECDYYKTLRELETLLIKAEAIHGH